MNQPPIYVCRVDTPEGAKDYVTVVPPESVFSKGLIPEAIVGVLLRPLGPDEEITPGAFARNRVFVDFLHDVLARHAPHQPDCQAEARRLGNGWVVLMDRRTSTPQGAVPPEDVVGALQAEGGRVVPGSYQRNPNHVILSSAGFFQLDSPLCECLLRELDARYEAR